jgi:hypothetical protein
MLNRFYGTDEITFTIISDEFNGITRGMDGKVRPVVARTFHSFSDAAFENGQSRIYLGVHWGFDRDEGIKSGRNVADYEPVRLWVRRGDQSDVVLHSSTGANRENREKDRSVSSVSSCSERPGSTRRDDPGHAACPERLPGPPRLRCRVQSHIRGGGGFQQRRHC